ncbi:short-chain dehydrogenase [Paraflavisolibacter sp. H34]|uniref:short-chain dehydrogenase n=1 Tax=Huijunlia imazamoxiresistens TaxID=3127457 RepID=UPI003017890E
MNIEEIEQFLSREETPGSFCIKISFKKRDAVYGLFVKDNDYNHLKSKNLWRIVTRTHFDQWHKTKDINLAKIFSGSDFSRLLLYKDAFEEEVS